MKAVAPPLEYWSELKRRQLRERTELIQSLSGKYTIRTAALILNMEEGTLRSTAYNYNIKFQRNLRPSKTVKK